MVILKLKLSFVFLNAYFRHYTMNTNTIAYVDKLRSKMNIYQVNQNVEKCLNMAAKLIVSGNIIAVPTDTIYGLAASAQNVEAVKKLYSIKGRESKKPIAICVPDIENLKLWGQCDHIPEDLLHELLPGPVTVILLRNENLNLSLNPGEKKIGIRIPNDYFIQKLVSLVNMPIALTSANKSNESSCVSVDEFSHLWSQLSAIFDGGKCGNTRSGSTIIDLSVPNIYKIVRSGCSLNTTINILHKFHFEENKNY